MHFDIRLLDSLVHFLSSGCAGLLAFYLTWTICWSWYRRVSPLPSRTSPPGRVARSIFRCSLSWGLCASIGAHVYIDYFIGGYTYVWT